MAQAANSSLGIRIPNRVTYQGVILFDLHELLRGHRERETGIKLVRTRAVPSLRRDRRSGKLKAMQPGFSRTTNENDAVKAESICVLCSQRLSAYTADVLNDKELAHKCREKRSVKQHTPGAKPRNEKLY